MRTAGFAAITCTFVAAMIPACSCPKERDSVDNASIHAPDYGGDWTLRTIEGVPAGPIVGDARLPTLTIEPDGTASGFAGINQLSSRFDPSAAARGEPLFGPIITTKMAGPDHLMALESRVVAALTDARTASIEAGNLALYSADGRELATFSPTAPTR